MRVRLLFLLLIIFAPALVHALGLGKLELESALNEPFEARIELLSATVEELDSLNVRLADEVAFSRAGIPRLSLLRSLNFVVKETETGSDYIRIYSNEPIREPFLNFLLEVSWSKGHLYREYTVLLDPPIYASPEKQRRLAPAAAPPVSTTGPISRGIEDHQVVYDPVYKPARSGPPSPVSRPISYDGGDYGPTATGDTLWSIASAMRPDSSVSVQQMMFALLRANPEAFINGNINGLKRGHVLKMPDTSELRSLAREEAFAQTQLHNGLWEEARGALATAVAPRPETVISEEPVTPEPVVTPEPAPVVVPPVEAEPELRLVAPAEEGEGIAGVTDPSSEQLANELALVNESLEALTQENLELKDRLSETEAIIDDLKRLIVLKESELAALQQQIAADEAARAAAEQEVIDQAAETTYEPEEDTETAHIIEEPVVEDEIVEEEFEETVAMEDTDTSMEDTETTESVSEEVTEIPATTFIPAGIAGLVDQIKNNLNYLAIGLGAILLIAIGALVVKRKRSEEATVIPQSAFPDFDEHDAESPEDATDINPALAASEAVTILPDSEDETSAPVFEEDVTKIVSTPQQAAKVEEPAAVEEEEDPFTEVNYFLAYEQYDQAEELVKKVIAKDFDNLENHTKLLEVYYAANNKKRYEEAARVLHDMVMGKGDHWKMAVAMWQEISPNRALFAESEGDEQDTGVAASGGGIVNITGDEDGATAGLDLDLDTTAGSGDVLDMTSVDEDADVLDVTAAIDLDDEAVLDVTAATDNESAGVDFSVDTPPAEEEVAVAADDNSLDFSFDLDKDAAKEEVSAGVDFSVDTPPAEEEVAVAADDNSLDFSFDLDKDAAKEEVSAGVDFSVDTPPAEEEVAVAADDNSLDFSFDLDKDAAKQESAPDVLDTSFNVTDDEKTGTADLLDVTSAISFDEDESPALDKDEGSHTGEDLLDVTKTRNFEPDSNEDLLDVTSATSAEMDADELLDSTKAGIVKEAEDNLIDFELSPDSSNESNEDGSELVFDGIDITAGQDSSGTEIDFNIDTDNESDAEPEIDMDGTMQMPKRAALDSDMDIEDEAPSGNEFELVIDEEDDDADHTIMVPRSAGTAQQTEEDEISSQLDLAKAYVELGDSDNAKTILNEIIAIGNDEQRQQAQELLGQI